MLSIDHVLDSTLVYHVQNVPITVNTQSIVSNATFVCCLLGWGPLEESNHPAAALIKINVFGQTQMSRRSHSRTYRLLNMKWVNKDDDDVCVLGQV